MKLYPLLVIIIISSLVTGCGSSKSNNQTPAPTAQLPDRDHDGIPDQTDLDNDNDGVPDTADAFPLNANEQKDIDSDGIGDSADIDDDNDGVADAKDKFPQSNKEFADNDNDGIGDVADLDDDNDAILDVVDGMPLIASEQKDSDGDGVGDNADLDDDNDTISDTADKFPFDAKENKDFDGDDIGDNADSDDDNDGVLDIADAQPFNPKVQKDADGDGLGDNEDPDNDNDGVADALDKFPFDAKESKDSDGDGIGDNADPDDDNDGVLDAADAQSFNPKVQKDADGDGIDDGVDADDDNDGVVDVADKFPFDAKEQFDFDSDGIGDNADTDDDNDGILDALDTKLAIGFSSKLAITAQSTVLTALDSKKTFVLNAADKTLNVVSLMNGEVLNTIVFNEQPKAIVLSNDQKLIYVASTISSYGPPNYSESGKIYTYDVADLSKKMEFNIDVDPSSTQFIGTNQLLVTSTAYSEGRIYDSSTGLRNGLSYLDYRAYILADTKNGFIYTLSNGSQYLNRYTIDSTGVTRSQQFYFFNSDLGNKLWLNPEKKYLITASGQLISTETMAVIGTLNLGSKRIISTEFDTKSDSALIVLDDNSLILANATSLEVIKVVSNTEKVISAFIMNDRLITLGKSDTNTLFIQNEDHICSTCQANGAPSADFSVDNASPENKHDVTFDASKSSDPNKDQLLYRWDFDGDGVWNTEFTSAATVKYQYLIAGNYSARLQIKDPLGAVASKTLPINVVQSKILPTPIANSTDFFDFPVSAGLFDGNSTVYYLDKIQRRLYLLDLVSGKASKYFQLDLEPKDMALSLDKKNLYLLLSVRDNAEPQVRSIMTIDLAQQAIVSSINVAEPLLSLRDIAGDYFYAQSNRSSSVLVNRQTGTITVLNLNFSQIFVSDTGSIFSYSDGLSTYDLQGTTLVKTGTIFKDYINSFGGNAGFISPDNNFGIFSPNYGIGFTSKERSVVQANAIVVKSVADAARNLVFSLSDNGVVDLFNTHSGQRIQTIDIGKKILDVIVQKDKLFFIVAVNNSQSALIEYPHPCLACANNLAPEVKLSVQSEPIQTGKPITLDASASIDEQIAALLFRWDLNGDGIWDTLFSAQATAQKEFTIPGVKFVSVQAKDIYGETGSKSVVLNATPGVVTAKSEPTNNTLAAKISSYLNVPVPQSNLFLIADSLKNKLYFYDVLLAQVTKEIDLEYSPELLLLTPDGKTAYVQIVDKAVLNVSSVSDKRYIAKIDVDNYMLSNTFVLASGSFLFTALNSERLLTRKDFQEIILADSKTGQSLSSATVSPFYSGRSIVVGKDIYIGATAIYSFENDVLTAKVNLNQYSNDASFWMLPGNKYILYADGSLADAKTLARLPNSTSLPAFTYAVFDEINHLGFLLTNWSIVVINTDTLQVAKRIDISNPYAILSAYFNGGELSILTSLGEGTSVTTKPNPCPECINNQAPTAKINTTTVPLDTSAVIEFDALGSSDPEQQGLNYRWDFDGDGIWDNEFSTIVKAQKKYRLPGSYTVTVQVKDAAGSTAQASMVIEVAQGIDLGTVYRSQELFTFIGRSYQSAVDEVNAYLYYNDQDRKRVYSMNLASGQSDKYFEFEYTPMTMKISADKKYLYIAQTNRYLNNSNLVPAGMISVIDLEKHAVVRNFKINTDPADIAALAHGLIAVSYAQSSLNASIEIYDVTTGLLVNNTQPLNSSSRLVTDSAGIGLYAFLPDTYSVKKYQFENNTLNLTGVSNNTSNDYWGRYGWTSPDGKYLVLDSGHILNTKDFSLYLKLSTTNSGAIRSVVFTSSDQINVLTEYGGVRKIDLATGAELSNITCMRCLSIFSLNNELFYIGDNVNGYQITGKL